MSKVTKTISVKADPRKVIEYISKVDNHPAFISALKSVENLSGKPHEVGSSWDWTFVMGGVELKGRGETAAYEEGRVYSFKTVGGAESTFTYSVEPEEGGSRLTLNVDYKLPDTVLAKIADKAAVERLNDQEGEQALGNLQAILSE